MAQPPYSIPPDRPPEYPGRGGSIRLRCDEAAEVYYIDASPGYPPSELNAVLDQAAHLGLEPLDPDDEQEGDAWTLDDGTTRIWLAEIAESAPLPGR